MMIALRSRNPQQREHLSTLRLAFIRAGSGLRLLNTAVTLTATVSYPGPYAARDLGPLMADTNRTEVPTAWLTRAGRRGEREDFVLEHGLAGSGFTASQTCRASQAVAR